MKSSRSICMLLTSQVRKMLMVPEMKDMLEKHADEVESEEGTSSEGSECGGYDDEEETGDDDNDSEEDCKKPSSSKDWEQSDDDKFDTDLEIEGSRTGNKENSVDDDDEDAEDDEHHVFEAHKKLTGIKQKQMILSDPNLV
ncbi:uncharacterized protein LOC135147364 isoform X2 [Daucus carota subsp. sativus]|uniref:uncharacterized protein LOC135147364 isoform X2 n=1 Tax=Daucus carota subsp. sativus TaxID=79200 RepID=UPI003083C7AE